MRVLLRCDSTKSQGLGHVIRTVALAEAARAAGHDVEFCGEIESHVGRMLIEEVCSGVHPRPAGPVELAQLARLIQADIVHIDTYSHQGDLRGELRKVGVLLSSVEDGSFGRRSADLVIDPSPGAEKRYRPFDGSHQLFRGARAVPIRRSLRNLRRTEPVEVSPSSVKDVLIVMGGTDARDMTSFFVELWAQTRVKSRCFVVDSGRRSGFPVDLANGQTLEVVQPSLQVPQLFPSMDLVVSGAGTTTWELATLGVPMALVQLVDNQAENYSYATENNMAFGLGNASNGALDEAVAVEGLRVLLKDDARRIQLGIQARNVVDGAGADRVVGYWEEMIKNRLGISIRAAEIGDAPQLFDWRNEPSVRAVSREKDELLWDDHVAWLARAILNPAVCVLMAQYDGAAAGTVRFQFLDDAIWEVSITIAPNMRGRGLASKILAAAEDHFRALHPNAVLQAAMLTSNVASYKLFLSAGYEGPAVHAGGESWYRLVKESQDFSA